jgi:hypothetical protein
MPQTAKFDLGRAARELRVLELERPRDPRIDRLHQEIRDQRWDADRAIRRARGPAPPPAKFVRPEPTLPPPKISFAPGDRGSLDRDGAHAADRAVR